MHAHRTSTHNQMKNEKKKEKKKRSRNLNSAPSGLSNYMYVLNINIGGGAQDTFSY